MKKLFIIFLFILTSFSLYSQEQEWEVFKTHPPLVSKFSSDDYYLSIATNGNGNKHLGYSHNSRKQNRINWFGNDDPSYCNIPDNFIVCITQDKTGNIWIGTLLGGIAKYDGANWTVFNTSNSGLPDNKIYCLLFDADEKLWIGTTSGLVRFDGKNWKVYKLSNSQIPSNIIYSMAIDREGNKWIGTAAGLAKFNGRKWTTFNVLNSRLPDDNVTAITIDAHNNKWIGTFEGLVRIEGVNWKIYNTVNSHLPYDDIYSIYSGGDEKMFIQTWGGGLAILNKNKWTVFDSHTSGLPDNYISSLVTDGNGNRWIGTLSGLVKYDRKKWTVFNSTNSDLPNNMVYSLYKDKNENLWIGTTHGLSVYKEGGIISIPALLTSFNSQVRNNNVTLFWQSEFRNDILKFEIEKKTDNTNWEKIGSLKSDKDIKNEMRYFFVDSYPVSGKNYYRLKQIDCSGSYKYSKTIEAFVEVPKTYFLERSFPNQADSIVLLKFGLPESADTKLIVYDFLGREVATLVDGYKQPGIYSSKFYIKKTPDTWDESPLQVSTYFYKIRTKNYTAIKKFFLLK